MTTQTVQTDFSEWDETARFIPESMVAPLDDPDDERNAMTADELEVFETMPCGCQEGYHYCE